MISCSCRFLLIHAAEYKHRGADLDEVIEFCRKLEWKIDASVRAVCDVDFSAEAAPPCRVVEAAAIVERHPVADRRCVAGTAEYCVLCHREDIEGTVRCIVRNDRLAGDTVTLFHYFAVFHDVYMLIVEVCRYIGVTVILFSEFSCLLLPNRLKRLHAVLRFEGLLQGFLRCIRIQLPAIRTGLNGYCSVRSRNLQRSLFIDGVIFLSEFIDPGESLVHVNLCQTVLIGNPTVQLLIRRALFSIAELNRREIFEESIVNICLGAESFIICGDGRFFVDTRRVEIEICRQRFDSSRDDV